MHNTLESHKFFPYVAWTLVVGFAVFTYMLTLRLQENLGNIDTDMRDLEMRIERLEGQRSTP
jgi:hypothetical protein